MNEALKKLEDPEKVMNQAVIDLQSDLVKIRQSYAEVMATQKKMEKQQVTSGASDALWLPSKLSWHTTFSSLLHGAGAVCARRSRWSARRQAAAAKLADEWMGRAQLALTKGDEELAREALTRKQQAAEQADSLAGQLTVQTDSLNKLYVWRAPAVLLGRRIPPSPPPPPRRKGGTEVPITRGCPL